MNIRNTTLALLLFLSLNTFAQNSIRNLKAETQNAYLDSIKSSFVHDNIASCVDSLWMKELTSLDIYNDLSVDIKNINIDQKVDYELSTELLKERLAIMDAKSPFNIEYNQGLENIIKSFLKNRKRSFERLMAISEYYFPMFEEAMARQNVPLEIKYLAVVESALNPKAVSKMGATGLWQFMYQTGKQYNLDINTYVDERSDPLKSSDAAALYMLNMYKIFGDWDLVLASYNSGPGNVAKAIRRSGGQQNYWNIRKNLPRETQGYVPAFLATMYIYEYHKEHGIVPNRAIIKHFQTDTIMVKQQISFKHISDLLCIPISQLQMLNPSYKRDVIPFISGQNNFLRLPNDKVAIYTSNEDKIYAYVQHEDNKRERTYERAIAVRDTSSNYSESKVVSRTKYHKVKRGDNLSEIAGKYGVAMSDIRKWNKLKSNNVPLGRSLKIHTNENIALGVKDGENAEKNPVVTNTDNVVSVETKDSRTENTFKEVKVVSFVKTTKSYKVKKGDNLGEIAAKYDVSVADIKKWNKLKSSNVAFGKSLKIITNEKVVSKVRKEIKPEIKTEKTTVETIVSNEAKETKEEGVKNVDKTEITTKSTEFYTVQKGDNLSTIARKHNATVAEIKEWNHLTDSNIQLGSTLVVSKKEIITPKEIVAEKTTKKDKLAAVSKKNQEHYFVRKGDSLYSIAKKYPGVSISDIKKWNGINGENLKPGMKLKING
ncbi:LysM peptidoglycan-binding domain-containing protein [Flavobacterium sp.]|uniref:LysM peptidoglycan-binding domain-containing protein n=1 Tax=Flavobacterium sp. TaxID=239 RepID=UPI002B4AED01|nr:LysM peptidoglycan-binding domain-containing protein [Flavobacterium sp.]HLF51549.1 LysM peptidoglycan-binding domain-containing protein [Flavobacterium sp.]